VFRSCIIVCKIFDRFLDKNRLTGSIPAALRAMRQLVLLCDRCEINAICLTASPRSYVDRNQLTGTIPPEILQIGELRSLYAILGDDHKGPL
jgi:hypothetical protein